MVVRDVKAALVSDEGFGFGPLGRIVSEDCLLDFGVMLPLSFSARCTPAIILWIRRMREV